MSVVSANLKLIERKTKMPTCFICGYRTAENVFDYLESNGNRSKFVGLCGTCEHQLDDVQYAHAKERFTYVQPIAD